MKKFNFISTGNKALSIFLLIAVSLSIIGIVFATAPDPGHNFTESSGSVAQGDLLYGSAADTLSALAKNTTATRYLSNTGSSNNPAWAQINLSNGVTDNLPVTNLNSGTGAITGKFWQGDGAWASTTGYTINVQALTSSPGDSVSNYFGTLPNAVQTSAAISKVYIRKAGTIKIAQIYNYSGTAGSAEAYSLYIRLNNTTDTLVATLSVSTNERVFTNSSLNINVVAGDYIEMKTVNPAWATNPLTSIFGGYIYIE